MSLHKPSILADLPVTLSVPLRALRVDLSPATIMILDFRSAYRYSYSLVVTAVQRFAKQFKSKNPVLLADLHGPIGMNCDRITHLNGFEEFVAQQIDRDDLLVVPDILHNHTSSGQCVNVP